MASFDVKEIVDEAYLFLYPLVLMDITRLQNCSVDKWDGMGPKAPMNHWGHFRIFPPLTFKEVVRPNFDTLYSITFLDLSDGPIVMHIPDSDGRYYLMPGLDMWTNVFAVPGWRTTGTGAQDVAFCPPGWSGSLPPGVVKSECPTKLVWFIGRTKTDGPPDYDAVHKFQDGMALTSLARWGEPVEAMQVKKLSAPSFVDLKAAPLQQIEKMPGEQFFAYAAELMKDSPPLPTDFSQVSRMRHIGIVPGESFATDGLSGELLAAVKEAPAAGHRAMRMAYAALGAKRAKNNGWSMAISPWVFGSFGIEYTQRAMIALVRLGCNQLQDAIYPQLLTDSAGEPLKGGAANKYTVHFDAEQLPPVKAFWSFTLYDADGFAVPNSMQRATLSSWMPLVYNGDGSLDLYFQTASPGDDKENNWLPTPEEKGWNLTLRLYAPERRALNGSWIPPPAVKE